MPRRCAALGGLVASLVVACGGRTGLSGGSEGGVTACSADCDAGSVERHVFANSDTTLYDISVPSGVVSTIGDTGLPLTDMALSPQNVLFGVSFHGLSKVTPSSGYAGNIVLPFDGYMVDGADFAPDGTLFISGGSSLLTVDQQTGTFTQVAQLPAPMQLGGDLAFLGDRLLVTASSGKGSDELLELDIASGTSTLVGSIGFSCVWGLAPVDASLFGFTCEGRVLSIDPRTGVSTEITRNPSITFRGAASR